MICSICGNDNENGSKFCFKCGNNMKSVTNNEPFIPRLDIERVSMPQPSSTPMKSQYQAGPPPLNIPQQPQQMNNPYVPPPQPMYNQYAQPQIIGYDPSGMPVYAPPPQPIYNQYAQPQIIGYDPSGMPVYAPPPQPMYNQYAQPQIIGYDQNGMPVYAHPTQPMYNQYSQPVYNQPPNMQDMPDMQIIPDIPDLSASDEKKEEEKVDISEDFWEFFDGGQSSQSSEAPSADDFFGKSSHGDAMGDISTVGLDVDSLKRDSKKKNSYMSDTPIVDADKLERYDPAKLNEMYMKKAEAVNSDDLGSNVHRKVSDRDRMGTTKQVDARRLAVKLKVRPRVSMSAAGEANPDELEVYIPEHNEAIMAQADSAVEAMPKRVNPYESEIDAIELPEYMQAKKTKKEEVIEIPSLPDLK